MMLPIFLPLWCYQSFYLYDVTNLYTSMMSPIFLHLWCHQSFYFFVVTNLFWRHFYAVTYLLCRHLPPMTSPFPMTSLIFYAVTNALWRHRKRDAYLRCHRTGHAPSNGTRAWASWLGNLVGNPPDIGMYRRALKEGSKGGL